MENSIFAASTPAISGVIERTISVWGDKLSLEKRNLAELERRTGVSCVKHSRTSEHAPADPGNARKGMYATTMLFCECLGIPGGLQRERAASVSAPMVCHHGGERYVDPPATSQENRLANMGHGLRDMRGGTGSGQMFSGVLKPGRAYPADAPLPAEVPGYDLAWVMHGKGGR